MEIFAASGLSDASLLSTGPAFPSTFNPPPPGSFAVSENGTEEVAELRRCFPPEKILPALYGCNGMVDVVTARQAVDA